MGFSASLARTTSRMYVSRFLLSFVVALLMGMAAAQMGPVWILSTNGHGYALVQDQFVRWEDVLVQTNYTFRNMTGYLATITTPAESAILSSLGADHNNGSQYFVGARDVDSKGNPTGIWKWMTGPDAGDIFYVEGNPPWKGTCYGYCNWCQANGFPEPDNSTVGKPSSCMTVMPFFDYTWNDAPDSWYSVTGYILEFGWNSSAVSIASANNVSSANISLQFVGGTPDHVITAREGGTSPPKVEFLFSQIFERAANGTIVPVFNFTDGIYFSQHDAPSSLTNIQEFQFVATMPPSSEGNVSDPQVSFTFTLFDDATTLPYAGGTLFIPASSVKWEMVVTDWPISPGHTLELYMDVVASPSIVSVWKTIYDSANATVNVILQMADGTLVSLLLPSKAVVDANVTVALSSLPSFDANSSQLHFVFPSFNNKMIYDPSAAILLGSADSSSSPDLGLPIGLSMGLTAFALFVITLGALAVAGLVVYQKVVKPRGGLNFVNWDGNESRETATS